MFKTELRPVTFKEHPITDIKIKKPTLFDITETISKQPSNFILKGKFSTDNYCRALLQKVSTLGNDQLGSFLSYQQKLVLDRRAWLLSLDDLLLYNADVFEDKLLLFKLERVIVVIQLAFQALGNSLQNNSVFDFEKVKSAVKEIRTVEDKLVFLYDIKAEYLQNKPLNINSDEISFDEKINIEIKKVHELHAALSEINSKKSAADLLSESVLKNKDFLFMMDISKRTAQSWREIGRVGYSQIGVNCYYKLMDVEDLLKRNYHPRREEL